MMDIILLWVFFGLTIALVMGAIEVGRVFGGRVYRRSKDEKEPTASTFVGTVLGLVAFILAFTFGIVTNRYDDRKALVLEEANAIGTAYLRADFLLDTERSKAKALFREYLDTRIEVVQSFDMARTEKLLMDSAHIQQELWDIAVANSAKDPGGDRCPLCGLVE